MYCKFILAENWQDSAHANVLKDNESSATGNQLVAVTGAKMVILELLQKLWVVLESEGQGRELVNQQLVDSRQLEVKQQGEMHLIWETPRIWNPGTCGIEENSLETYIESLAILEGRRREKEIGECHGVPRDWKQKDCCVQSWLKNLHLLQGFVFCLATWIHSPCKFCPIQYGVYVGPRRADRRIWNIQEIFEYDDKKGLFLVRPRSSRDGKWFCAVL